MKKLIQSFNWVAELLLTAVVIVTVTAGLMQVTAGAVYASESTAEEVPDKEYLMPENLPDDTDYVLVMDKSGSMWDQSLTYTNTDGNKVTEIGVFEKIRNSAAQAFLRVAAGTNNRIAVVYFDNSADSKINGCTLTDLTPDDVSLLKEKLSKTFSGEDKTTENASTNIAAGLREACNILDTRGSIERKKCIILFSDGYNDKWDYKDDEDRERYKTDIENEIFGTPIDETSDERMDDGLTARIKKSKYELYCIYLENPESIGEEEDSKENLEKLVRECRMDNETKYVNKFYYLSIIPENEAPENESTENEDPESEGFQFLYQDIKNKYFDLAKFFSEVFYVSQNNSRHRDFHIDSDTNSQLYEFSVPNAAVRQLNMVLFNVPATSKPVLRNTDTSDKYSFECDTNEPEMAYCNIDNPPYGDYELVIPDADDVRGVYAYYTELRAVVDIEKTNGFGLLPIGQLSKVKVKCSFFDSKDNPYDIAGNKHFQLYVDMSQDENDPDEQQDKNDSDEQQEESDPDEQQDENDPGKQMEQNGNSWETVEDIKIAEIGTYKFTITTNFDNDTINSLKYTKQINVTAMDYWIWIYGVLAVIAIIALCKLYVWLRRKVLQDKIAKAKKEIEAEKRAMEAKDKEINSNTKKYEKWLDDYEEIFSFASVFFAKHKEAKTYLLLNNPKPLSLLDEVKDYRTLYKTARAEYDEFYSAAINRAEESIGIDCDEKDGINSLRHKYSQAKNCLDKFKISKKGAKTKASELENFVNEAKGKYEWMDRTLEEIKEKMKYTHFNCGIMIEWPSHYQPYYVDMRAHELKYGIKALDDLAAIPNVNDLSDTTFKGAIGNYETSIIILPYRTEKGVDGIEMQRGEDFTIEDHNSNISPKSCEPIDPKQPDGKKKYVAKLEQGGCYNLNLHSHDGVGEFKITVS